MNNDISIRPAYLDSSGPAEAFPESIGFGQPPRISMDSQRFNVIDENGDAVLPASLGLNVIILWVNDTRIYYGGPYDPDKPAPPSCFSSNKIRPDDAASEPQSELCANCPRAVRDTPGFMGKGLVSACKEEFKVACLVAGAKEKVFLLQVKPASRRPFSQYYRFLKDNRARPDQVITQLTYAENAFSFSFQGWVDERTAAMVKTTMETDEPALIVSAPSRLTALPAPSSRASFERPSPTFGPTGQTPSGGAPIQGSVEPPKRSRGRPPKPIEPAGPPPASFAASNTPPAPSSAPTPSFGMGTPMPMRDDMQARLNEAFGR